METDTIPCSVQTTEEDKAEDKPKECRSHEPSPEWFIPPTTPTTSPEGMSTLDGENERKVLDAVRALERKPTVSMATPKLEVMRACDRIVVVGKGGKVVEDGGFEELMERRGEFARLASGGDWEC